MNAVNKYFLALLALLALSFTACQDKWEEHTELEEAVLNENLLVQIQANPNLSKFHEYLVQTGYAEVLQATRTFTVWAPSNQALASLDPAIAGNPEQLKAFIANHISYQRHFTSRGAARIKMLSGKYLTWADNQLDGVAVEANAANRYSGNGVVHVLAGLALPRPNIYEFMTGTTLATKQAAYIRSRNFMQFVADRAEIDHIDPATGEPVYKPGTGLVPRNTFFDRTVDLQREDSLYTMILLTDGAYNAEYNKISRFFNYPDADTMAELTNFHLVKDLVFRGLISPENLPDTLTSAFQVKVPIDKSAIVQTVRTSNGIVYVMNKVNFRLQDKVPAIKIEGESPWFFTRGLPDNTHRRYRTWASNMLDIRVSGHGVSGFTIYYRAPAAYAAKYKVYYRAVNDFQDATFRQRLRFGSQVSAWQDVPRAANPAAVKEVLLGEFTSLEHGALAFDLEADGTNPLVLDYIKLVPVY
jgi:uncharacterized surface protein with fasciclin (FAS1) repeats